MSEVVTLPRATRSVRPSRTMRFVSESLTLAVRSIRLSWRKVDALLTSLLLPVMMMLLFVYLFGGAIHTGTSYSYVNYVVPGVILLCIGLGSSTTAVSVSEDMKLGIVDRFKSLDIGGPAFLIGHVMASFVRNLASTTIVFGVALLIGFRPVAGAVAWLVLVGVLFAVILAISWASAVFGLVVHSPEAASGLTFFVIFIPYASSGFVPINTMPIWLRGFAHYQPATPVIDTFRGLLLNQPLGSNLWMALLWCGGALIFSVLLSSVLFQRRTA